MNRNRTRIVLALATMVLACVGLTVNAAIFDLTIDGFDFTIVEADAFVDGGTAGNTVSLADPSTAWATVDSDGTDGLWRIRDDFGSGYSDIPGATNQSFEVMGADQLDGLELVTSVSDLDPGLYDVFVMYINRGDGTPAGQSAILADLNGSAITQHDQATVDHIVAHTETSIWHVSLSRLGTTDAGSTDFTVQAKGYDPPGPYNRSDYVGVAFTRSSDTTPLADYLFGSVSSSVTDRTSSDTEPLTLAGDVTGGADATGDAGGISLTGDVYDALTTDDAFTDGDYLEFTIELDQATSMSIQRLNFSIDLVGFTSVNNYALRSSIDSFTADIDSGNFDIIDRPGSTTETFGLGNVEELQDVMSDITFRLAFAGGVSGMENGALLSSIEVNGSVEGDIGITGDFDDDGDVDGADFLLWQRGESPNGGSPEDLADWGANFATTEQEAASATAIPEPASLALLGMGGLILLLRRRRV